MVQLNRSLFLALIFLATSAFANCESKADAVLASLIKLKLVKNDYPTKAEFVVVQETIGGGQPEKLERFTYSPVKESNKVVIYFVGGSCELRSVIQIAND